MFTKMTHILMAVGVAMSLAIAVSPAVYAQTDNWEVGDGGESRTGGSSGENWKNCGGADTSILACPSGESDQGEATIIWILRFIVVLMTMGVGVLAVAGVVYAGILYASAAGSQEQVKKAKMMLFNVAIGLVAYAFMYAITNFLIPGGVFNG